MLNKAQLIGRLGSDPETRTANNGTVVCTLRIATEEYQGQGKDRHTEWHRVVCFGKTAEAVAKHLDKGRQVYVEGKIRTRKWTDQSGNERWSTEILADEIRFLGERQGGGNGGNNRAGGSGHDDDIPF